jgi:putative nucleotidyltransferase with HDIG domain
MNTERRAEGGGGFTNLLTWPFRHIRWKIVLPYAFLTLVLAAAGSFLATRLVTGPLNERFDNQLAEAGRVVSDSVVRRERDHLETLRAVAFTEGLAEAAAARDGKTIGSLVEPIAANARVERLEVLTTSGARLSAFAAAADGSRSYEPISDGDLPASWPLVQRVIQGEADDQGDKFAQLVETEGGHVFFYTAGPVHDKSGGLAGVVLVGTSVETFLRDAKAEALADITVYDFDGAPLASTFARPDDASAGEARLDIAGEVLSGATAGDPTIREHRTIWGRGYDLAYGRLAVRSQAVGIYSVGLPTEFIFNAGTTTRTQVAILFGVGMALVLGIGLFLAHRLTQPILRLVSAARLVASGDLTVRTGVRSGDEIGTLASSFDEMTGKLQSQHLATIRALTSAIDARDPYTLGHSMRVGQLAVMVGKQLGLDDKTLASLEVGGYLHDIGKIGIRDAVLLKPGALTDEERRAIHDHPRIGLAILDPVDLPDQVIQFVAGHHERLDGSGYPEGLSDDGVPIVARIAAVADVYDAITSDRPYRGPMSPDEALAVLRAEARSMLDPVVVEALAAVLDVWERRRVDEPLLQGFKLPDWEIQEVTV